MNDTMLEQTVGDIVTQDFRTAAVFQRHGIDFCCGGGRTLQSACETQGIDPAPLLQELATANTAAGQQELRYADWDPDFLADFIVQTHHTYLNRIMPVITGWGDKVAAAHGANHPEVIPISDHVASVCRELTQHMFKEEQILFPAIKSLVAARRNGTLFTAPFGSIANPIRMMEAEHENAGNALAEIRRLSGGFTLPADACNTFTAFYTELAVFEADLHRHVHLENNILFPRAIAMEQAG